MKKELKNETKLKELLNESGLNLIAVKKELDFRLSENFSLNEFKCRCNQCRIVVINVDHIVKLQAFRYAIGAPLHVASAYRCEHHNKNIRGAKNSQHMFGTATDLVCRTMSPKELHARAEDFDFDGIGLYSSFIHVDSRGYRARW